MPLRFLGAHLFDLLDKLAHEGGPSELDRRRVICAALNAVATSGAPVVRIWGSLKHTGTDGELEQAASLLALVLDENARRARPLRFIVTLLNHPSGYGSPRPDVSLDDQDPVSVWSARKIYLEGSWRTRGQGQILERLERFEAQPSIVGSPNILVWELVNELDVHRVVAGGTLDAPEARRLRDLFLIPALHQLAARFPQPIMLGDLRAQQAGYVTFARRLVTELSPRARARLVWTSHVYAPAGASPTAIAHAVSKLDLDLAIATELGLPFVLGELGEYAETTAGFCKNGAFHDPATLMAAILGPRPAIDAVLFWGEGQCDLEVSGRHLAIGAGGDSADLGPGDAFARAAVRTARTLPRFCVH